jgi:hypothetical protein
MDDRAQFVGRTAELEYILQHVYGLRNGVTPQRCLVNICGAHGLGKGALLAALAQHAAQQADLLCLSIQLPLLPPEDKMPSLAMRQAIIQQLSAAVMEVATAPPADEAATDAALADLAARLVAHHDRLLLLIEAETRTAPVSFGWLERGLLLPLVRAERLVAVVTSRAPLRWRELDTRRRAETRTLAPLSLAETAAQLGLDPDAARPVYALTIGVPLANQHALAMLREQPDPADWDAATQTTLARRIVAQIYLRIGPALTPELRCALETLAIVREFSIPLMQRLLSFCHPPGQPRNQALQLMMVRQLQDLDLIAWEHASTSWRVVPVLRHLIAERLRRDDPQRYRAIQRVACDYYRQMLDEVLVSRHIHMTELLWHSLDSQDATSQSVAELLRELVRTYLVSPDGRQADYVAIAALRERMLADPDLPTTLLPYEPHLEALMNVLDQTVAERV